MNYSVPCCLLLLYSSLFLKIKIYHFHIYIHACAYAPTCRDIYSPNKINVNLLVWKTMAIMSIYYLMLNVIASVNIMRMQSYSSAFCSEHGGDRTRTTTA